MTVEPAGRGSATRSVLRRPDFRYLLLSFGTSRLGDFLYTVALVVYIYDLTGSPAWVSAAALARFLPHVLLSPISGLVADRYGRRTVMLVSDLVSLAAMGAITVCTALAAPPVLVLALVAVAATAATLYQACGSAMVRDVVPEDELAAGNSLLATLDNIAFLVGPAAGGLLLLLGAPTVAFGINTATFALSALFVAGIRARSAGRDRTARPGALRELREGVAVFLARGTTAVLVGCLVAGTVVFGVELVVLVLVSDELLGTGPQGVGWLMAASGAGGVLGALVSARLADSSRPRITAALLVLLTGLPLAALAMIRLPALAYLVLLVEGIAIITLDVLVATALQRTVPARVLGRVTGLTLSLTAAGTSIGTLLAPLLVDGVGLVATLALAGVVPVVLAAGSLVLVPGLAADVAGRRRVLAPRVALLQQLRLLEGADRAGVERLAAAAAPERAPAGTVLLRQGDPADDLLILVDGELAVDHEVDGSTSRIAVRTAPDYVGEIGLVRRIGRTATVTASTDVLLWRIPGDVFLDAVSSGTTVPSALAGRIGARMAATPAARG